MGQCKSAPADPNHIAITKALRKDKKERDKTLRILLLGAGDSGKTTFLKQMKFTHSCLTPADYNTFKRIVRDNLIDAVRTLYVSAGKEDVKVSKKARRTYEYFTDEERREWGDATGARVAEFWEDPGVKQVWRTFKLKYHFLWCTDYLFKNASRICATTYEPSEADIFRARLKSTGVKETNVSINNVTIQFVDVGGQRSERRKWIRCFEGVDAIIYLVALDEYNMTITENNSTNRLEESLGVLSEVSGSKFVNDKEIPFIVFLNKFDLYKAKAAYVPLSDYFPEYKGDASDWEEGIRFIGNMIHNRFEGFRIANTYVTNGLDTRNCSRVFQSIYDEILLDNLSSLSALSRTTSSGSAASEPNEVQITF